MKKESRVAVIGDIHGCYYTLLNLFERIKDECTQVFTVGDLIDRGHYSKEVVQFCIDNNIMPVRGNHEDMLINAIGNSGNISAKREQDIDLYFYNGGNKTQKSYINSKHKKDIDVFKKELKHRKNHPLRVVFLSLICNPIFWIKHPYYWILWLCL